MANTSWANVPQIKHFITIHHLINNFSSHLQPVKRPVPPNFSFFVIPFIGLQGLFHHISSCFNTIFAGLQEQFHHSGLKKKLKEDEKAINKLTAGTNMLLVGMVSWLALISVATVTVFIIVYKRLGRNSQGQDDKKNLCTQDAESVISEPVPSKEERSVVDFDDLGSFYDPRYMAKTRASDNWGASDNRGASESKEPVMDVVGGMVVVPVHEPPDSKW